MKVHDRSHPFALVPPAVPFLSAAGTNSRFSGAVPNHDAFVILGEGRFADARKPLPGESDRATGGDAAEAMHSHAILRPAGEGAHGEPPPGGDR